MEGIISDDILEVQARCVVLGGWELSLDKWIKGMFVKLMEVVHGE